jgi:hypothetical protein
MLTNGKQFEFYKILFNKPIESRKMFSVDLSDASVLKTSANQLQYLHKEAIIKKSLKFLWNKCEALHPENIAGVIYSKEVLNTIKRLIKNKYGEKCEDEELIKSLNRILSEKFDPVLIRPYKSSKTDKRGKKSPKNAPLVNMNSQTELTVEHKEDEHATAILD